MLRRLSSLRSLALGLIMTCAQIAIAVGFSNPEGSLVDRYRSEELPQTLGALWSN